MKTLGPSPGRLIQLSWVGLGVCISNRLLEMLIPLLWGPHTWRSKAGGLRLASPACPITVNTALVAHSHSPHLHIVRGCFHVIVAELSSCDRDHMAPKNIYCLALYRKSLPVPAGADPRHPEPSASNYRHRPPFFHWLSTLGPLLPTFQLCQT